MSFEKKPVPRANSASAGSPSASASQEEWTAYVLKKIESLKYGSLQIVIHDGRILRVEATEKVSFQSPPRTT